MEKIASLYKITNQINQKSYIGITIQNPPTKRWWAHKNTKQREQQKGKLLYRAFNKYGVDNFTFEVIIQSKDSQHIKNEMEPYFIQLYKSHWTTGGYNLALGGEGVWGMKHSKVAKEKMRQSKLEHFKDPEYKKRHNTINVGRIETEEHKQKISIGCKKYYETHNGPWKDKNLSDTHKQKQSQTMKVRGHAPSKKAHEASADRCAITCDITHPDGHIERHKNLKQFADNHNLSYQCLWLTMNGRTKQHKGYKAKKVTA